MTQKAAFKKSVVSSAVLFFALMALILDAENAAASTREGIRLCLQAVIPALFPFLVLGRLFTGSAAARWCTRLLGPVVEPVFGLPRQCASALVLGAVGGYPVGAQTAAELYETGALDAPEAERLLGFCSNAGPAFLFGMVGGLLGSMRAAAVLYGIHLISAVCTGILLRPRRPLGHSGRMACGPPPRPVNLATAIGGALRSMGIICGCIIVFQVITGFLGKVWHLWMPSAMEIAFTGLLELTGGCCRLPELSASGVRYCMASGFLAFGGLCVWLQTRAVIQPAGLTGRYYLFGKVLQGSIAVLLTWGCMVAFPNLLPKDVPTVVTEAIPNHTGLLKATGLVTAVLVAGLGLWCLSLGKRAGKQEASGV